MSIEGLQKNRESESVAELRKKAGEWLRARRMCAGFVTKRIGHSSKHGLLHLYFTNRSW